MNERNWRTIGWQATGNLLVVFILLTGSVAGTLWVLTDLSGGLGLFQLFLVGLELVGLVAIGTMVYFLYRRVLEPLQWLSEDTAAVADGELRREIRGSDRDDEIGSMTRSVVEMRDRLLESIEQTRLFEQAVEEAGHSVIITDTDEVIQYVNPAFERISGYSRAEAIGETPRILRSGDTDPAVYEDMWETLADGDVWEGEVTNQRKTGERFLAQMTIAPIENEAGETEYYVGINTEVTAVRLREQVLSVYNRVLRHNLRNRVNVVNGNAELVRDRHAERVADLATTADRIGEETDGNPSTPEELADSLEAIADDLRTHAGTVLDAGERLAELNEKARLADQVTEMVGTEPTPTPLSGMLRDECASVERDYPAAEVQFSIPAHSEIPYRKAIQTAIGELVENAVEHNDRDTPTVDVVMEHVDEGVVVRVADDGPGIPEHEQAVLREGEETPLAHGSGLGLWLVYWIVTMNGGRLEIRDNEPRGTVVEMTLPATTGSRTAGHSSPMIADD
ncbi:MAG: sensor histidine kinase [Halanaeroarchaeum sp.]